IKQHRLATIQLDSIFDQIMDKYQHICVCVVCLHVYALVTKSNSKSNEKNKNKANKRYGCENEIIATTSILMALNFLQAKKHMKVREILEFGKQTFPSMQEQSQQIANDQLRSIHDTSRQMFDWEKINLLLDQLSKILLTYDKFQQQTQQLSVKLHSFKELLEKKSVELLKISELDMVIVISEFYNNQWSSYSI
ncbi:hypothetical protein RFI_38308, partial [Reticulomyxa filosa]